MEKTYIHIGEEQYKKLAEKDPALTPFLEGRKAMIRERIPDPFEALLYIITGQQISASTQEKIFKRLKKEVGIICPTQLQSLPLNRLLSVGLPERKAFLIGTLANDFGTGKLKISNLTGEEDEIEQTLLAYPGIGPWTVEMYLIFCLGREDILSYKDLGIRRGMESAYGIEKLDKKQFDQIRLRLSPFGTAASFLFWEIAANKKDNLS